MKYLALLALVVLMTSLADARTKRSVGTLILKASPRVAVQGLTEEIKVECLPGPTVKNILLSVIIHLDRIDENGTTSLVASKRINALQITEENNRTSAVGHLQTESSDQESKLTVTISKPVVEDDGIYQCRFVYIDVALNVYRLESKLNITVKELPPLNYTHTFDCDCDNIWSEIEQLKAAIAVRNEAPGQPASPFDDKCRTSFSARFETRHGYLILGDTVAIFDHIISNKGGNYNPTTGIFKAPCDGQYFFTASLRSHQNFDSGYVDGVIVVDNVELARTSVYIDSPVENYQSATNGVVLSLDAGQEVKVLVKTTSSGEFVGEGYSIFTGFFLFP